MENPYPKPAVSPLEIALVMVATFFIFVYVSVISQLTFGDAPTLIVGEFLILLVPLIYLILKRMKIKSYVKIDLNPKFILIGLGFGVLLLFLNIAVSNVLTYFLGTSQAVEDSNQLISNISASPLGMIAVAISLGLAGVCEEFAFRGFLQNSIFKRLQNSQTYQKIAFPIAAFIAALIFGLFHFDPQGVYTIAALVSGLALGYIYHRWNYVTSATAHGTMNLIVLVLLLLAV